MRLEYQQLFHGINCLFQNKISTIIILLSKVYFIDYNIKLAMCLILVKLFVHMFYSGPRCKLVHCYSLLLLFILWYFVCPKSCILKVYTCSKLLFGQTKSVVKSVKSGLKYIVHQNYFLMLRPSVQMPTKATMQHTTRTLHFQRRKF